MTNEKLDKMKINHLELESLEIYIHNKTSELVIPEVDSIFEEMCKTYGIQIEKDILTKQLALIEEEEKNIIENFNIRDKAIKDELERLYPKKGKNDVENEIIDLNYKLEQLNLRHVLRNDAINKWKNDVNIVLLKKHDGMENENDIQKTARLTQEVFLNKIDEVLKEKNINEDDQSNFKKTIQNYLSLIEKHELYSNCIIYLCSS